MLKQSKHMVTCRNMCWVFVVQWDPEKRFLSITYTISRLSKRYWGAQFDRINVKTQIQETCWHAFRMQHVFQHAICWSIHSVWWHAKTCDEFLWYNGMLKNSFSKSHLLFPHFQRDTGPLHLTGSMKYHEFRVVVICLLYATCCWRCNVLERSQHLVTCKNMRWMFVVQ